MKTLILVILAACSTELPPAKAGDRIEGTVVYTGDAAKAMTRPAFQALAFYSFPSSTAPYALDVVETADPSTPTVYELDNLAASPYFVYAQLVDLDAPDADTSMNPGGGYPNFCALFAGAGNGSVTVTDDAPATNIDVTLFDYGGGMDPCFM